MNIRHATDTTPDRRLGWLAAGLTVLIGAAWQLSTRWGVSTSLAPIDLGLLRYTIPAAVLLPIIWRQGLVPRAIGRTRLCLMVLGGGLPFGLLVMAAAQRVDAAHIGALLPGLAPVCVVLATALLQRQALRAQQALPMVVILVGIASVIQPWLSSYSATQLVGDGLLVAACCAWSAYTLAFRSCGLSAWQGTALVAGWSALAALPVWLASSSARLMQANWGDVALQVAMQGLVAGIVAQAAFAFAVSRVGAQATTSLGALVPIAVALGAYWVLDEPLGWWRAGGAALIAAGALALARAGAPRKA